VREEVERNHAAGRGGLRGRQQEEGADQHEARHHHGLDDRLEVRLVHEPPELGIEAEESEQAELHQHDEADGLDQQVLVARGYPGVEAQGEREVVGKPDQARVDAHLDQAAQRHGGCNPGSHLSCRRQ